MNDENMELVSIIIPVYNAKKFIKETINTIKNQTYTNWEAIFVDDCSMDSSNEIIKQYQTDERIKLITLEKNEGVAEARNIGIENAKRKIYCFFRC